MAATSKTGDGFGNNIKTATRANAIDSDSAKPTSFKITPGRNKTVGLNAASSKKRSPSGRWALQSTKAHSKSPIASKAICNPNMDAGVPVNPKSPDHSKAMSGGWLSAYWPVIACRSCFKLSTL